jgi:predicted MFS family arabinose efflux permease
MPTMNTIDSPRGRFALMVAHCAGMVDLVALPIWVGALMSRYGFDPQQAGLLATLFLAGAVVASLGVAPRIGRLPGRWLSTLGFGLSAAAFLALSTQSSFALMAPLHAMAGMSAGCALSMTHGTIARSQRPHRLFAMVGVALGVFGILFMGITPQIIAAMGGPALFQVFGGVMLIATVVSALFFPQGAAPSELRAQAPRQRIARVVWFGIFGISAMALVQAMSFSFLERAGADRGFAAAAVMAVLVAGGVVNLLPAALAALLEKLWSARTILVVGPVLQALLVIVIMNSTHVVPYAVAGSTLVAVMIFTHTFAFGLLATLEPTGRALAATPAMLMIGAAIGPVLGGTLVKAYGYGSLGAAAAVMAIIAVACMSRLPQQPKVTALQGEAA